MPSSLIRDPARLANGPFDVLVVGAGIYGACTAYDAAQRGARVALIDRADIGAGVSFNNFKTIHGGLRYLQSGDVARVRRSIKERRAFARIAPHLVAPLGFLMPTTSAIARGRLAMSAAFAIDRVIGWDRNDGVAAGLRLPPNRVISRGECVGLFPELADAPITGGALWYDYQMASADRTTLSFAQAAAAHGAAISNYVEAVDLLRDGAAVCGVRARDVVSGDAFDVRATITVNCAGPWARRVWSRVGVETPLPLIKAMNVVTRRPAESMAIGRPTPSGRLLIRMPWRGVTILGTGQSDGLCTEDEIDGASGLGAPSRAASFSDAELDGFLSEINAAFPALQLDRSEIALVHRGLAPAVTDARGRADLRPHGAIIDHATAGAPGLISIVGVKYTTARALAESAVTTLAPRLGRALAACRTDVAPLPGGDIHDVGTFLRDAVREDGPWLGDALVERFVRRYGSTYRVIADAAREDPRLGIPVAPDAAVTAAEVLHAVRREMALCLEDVLVRRVDVGAVGYPGAACVQACASVMQRELGWSDSRVEAETARVRAFYEPVRV